MFNWLIIKYKQLIEKIKSQGYSKTIQEVIFFNKIAVTFNKNLFDLQIDSETLKIFENEIINISNADFNNQYSFSTESRYLKAITNTKNGYEAFFFIRNNEVIGDCWFATSLDTSKKQLHSDMQLFDMIPKLKSAYMFDMYVKPEERGTKVTSSILKFAFHCFKERGITDVYTYVMSDNTPAIWMVRTLGFKELNKIRMNRFFFYRRTSK